MLISTKILKLPTFKLNSFNNYLLNFLVYFNITLMEIIWKLDKRVYLSINDRYNLLGESQKYRNNFNTPLP